MSMLQGRIYDNLMQVVDGDGKRKRESERDTARKLFFFTDGVARCEWTGSYGIIH